MKSPSPAAPFGAVQSAFNKLVARTATVRKVEAVGAEFRLVTLAGEDLEDRTWTAGDMIQIAFAGWESRAYTPLSFDPRTGSLTFLGYVHGNGIGSAWLASLEAGGPCVFVGPRSAVNLNAARRPAIFFGDETSFSTAAAMQSTAAGSQDVTFLFEVSAIESARAALDRIGLSGAVTLTLREEGDRHLDHVGDRVLDAFRRVPGTHGVLTGRAASIQWLYKSLRKSGVSAKQVTNVAYWAPGRKGFSGVQR